MATPTSVQTSWASFGAKERSCEQVCEWACVWKGTQEEGTRPRSTQSWCRKANEMRKEQEERHWERRLRRMRRPKGNDVTFSREPTWTSSLICVFQLDYLSSSMSHRVLNLSCSFFLLSQPPSPNSRPSFFLFCWDVDVIVVVVVVVVVVLVVVGVF